MPGAAKHKYDAVVVGSGPNGLAAAVRLAQSNLSVLLIEGAEAIGGATHSAELTLPGFIHDVCSAVHPLGLGSPFFRQLHLDRFGLNWIEPEIPMANPLEGGRAAVLYRSLSRTAQDLGVDGSAYASRMGPLVAAWEPVAAEFLQPLLHWPRRPMPFLRFGWLGMRSATGLARSWFRTEEARALFGGMAAHAFLPLEQVPSAVFGLVLGMMGHTVGWPFARGGSRQIADALASLLKSLSGEIVTGWWVKRLDELPRARVVLLDVTPNQLIRMLGDQLPPGFRAKLERFRYGPGVFKLDHALDGPIPWTAKACGRAGTVHVGGTLDEIAQAEREVARGYLPERPFVLLAQPSVFDNTRSPQGRHTAWAYCHVPNGSVFDMTSRIEAQIERFAPGFRDRILARHARNGAEMERTNPNLVGGSINGGASDLRHLVARPFLGSNPYRLPIPGVYLCSSSTPPGGGVHGMCGYHAAESALRDCFH